MYCVDAWRSWSCAVTTFRPSIPLTTNFGSYFTFIMHPSVVAQAWLLLVLRHSAYRNPFACSIDRAAKFAVKLNMRNGHSAPRRLNTLPPSTSKLKCLPNKGLYPWSHTRIRPPAANLHGPMLPLLVVMSYSPLHAGDDSQKDPFSSGRKTRGRPAGHNKGADDEDVTGECTRLPRLIDV